MKKWMFFGILVFFFMVSPREVFAFSSRDYKNRSLCGFYEVAEFHSDGRITTVSCNGDYGSAKNFMKKNGGDNLAILTKVDGQTAIVDANVALVDFEVSPSVTNIYTKSSLSFAFTYMNAASAYGGIDGVFLDGDCSTAGWVAKVLIADRIGWVAKENYEIVPYAWVKSSSSYTVTDTDIRHNYVTKIQEPYYGSSGRTIGPKPTMLSKGTYYSYDGHYFYKDIKTMIKDNCAGSHANAVNKNEPYYNYYMYLSNHTKTNYSSVNIDEYIRNNMNIIGDVYGNTVKSNTSRLYGQGTFFYYAQEKYGVNAILALSLSRNETGNGTSSLAVNKNNGFGLNAVDSNPYANANGYANFSASILGYARDWVTNGYAYPRDWRYFGPQFGNKLSGMNVKYASDAYWSEKMASNYYAFDAAKGLQDYNYYQLGVTTSTLEARRAPSTQASVVYEYPEAEDAVVIVGETQGTAVNGNTTWYEVMSDLNIDGNYNEITSGEYNWNGTVYVPAAFIRKINQPKNGYQSPSDVIEYQDKDYEYDMLIENGTISPLVGKITKTTSYYYEPTLSTKVNDTIAEGRVIMVYAIAKDKNGQVVSYQISSNMMTNQKEWIPASHLQIIASNYGRLEMGNGNINVYQSTTRGSEIIGGFENLYYFPILSETVVKGVTWYEVPVNLNGYGIRSGWIRRDDSAYNIVKLQSKTKNNAPVIVAENRSIVQGMSWDKKANVKATDVEDGDLTSKIEIIEDTVNTQVVGTYRITYRVMDNGGLTATKTISVTVTANQKPEITASDIRMEKGQDVELLKGVTAKDSEDGDLTSQVKVLKSNVQKDVVGTYQVTYQVTDSFGNTVTKQVNVYVLEHITDAIEKEGSFYFDSLKEVDGKLQIKGYHAVNGLAHTKDKKITFEILFENIQTKEITKQSLTQITDVKEMTVPVYHTDNVDYTYSWFKGTLDIDKLKDGDYRMYLVTTLDNTYAKSLVNNPVFMPQITTYHSKKYVTTRNNYMDENIALELIVREEEIAKKTASSIRNEYNQFEKLEFINNQLHISGLSYSFGMNLAKEEKVERQIIFENTKTYKKYRFDVGSITNGAYVLKSTLKDNMDKTRAWFDANLDLKEIEKGNYAIYIATKSNIEDYEELSELLFRSVDKIKWEWEDKTYSFKFNKDLRYRIELNVE